MKVNKLKVISIAICCLVASLWSEAQCMDNHTDILELEIVNRTANIELSFQNEINDLALESTLSQSISLEDSKTSWVPYLFSQVKYTMQVANEFMSIATRNPKLAMVVGFTYILPTLVASQDCCVRYFMNGVEPSCDLLLRNDTCLETSTACSYAQGCYTKKMMLFPCGKMEYSPSLSISISLGACSGGNQ